MDFIIGLIIGLGLGVFIMYKSLNTVPGVKEALAKNGRNILTRHKKL